MLEGNTAKIAAVAKQMADAMGHVYATYFDALRVTDREALALALGRFSSMYSEPIEGDSVTAPPGA